MTEPARRAPEHLSLASKSLWKQLHQSHNLEPHHEAVLLVGLEARDRAEQARLIVEADGPIVDSPRGGKRPHPAIAIERDSRSAFVRIFRELGLDATGDRTNVERTQHGREVRWQR